MAVLETFFHAPKRMRLLLTQDLARLLLDPIRNRPDQVKDKEKHYYYYYNSTPNMSVVKNKHLHLLQKNRKLHYSSFHGCRLQGFIAQ